jgi:hypothetical protein
VALNLAAGVAKPGVAGFVHRGVSDDGLGGGNAVASEAADAVGGLEQSQSNAHGFESPCKLGQTFRHIRRQRKIGKGGPVRVPGGHGVV